MQENKTVFILFLVTMLVPVTDRKPGLGGGGGGLREKHCTLQRNALEKEGACQSS